MITKNFKAVVASLLQSNGQSSIQACLPVTTATGAVHYLEPRFPDFPYNVTRSMVISNSLSRGVWIGRGNTAPTENDYTLEDRIISGLTAGSPTESAAVDGDGNIYKDLIFVLTNTTASDITIKEIGYVQTFRTSSSVGGTAGIIDILMLDRTVLEPPLTVPANGNAALKYRMKTIV